MSISIAGLTVEGSDQLRQILRGQRDFAALGTRAEGRHLTVWVMSSTVASDFEKRLQANYVPPTPAELEELERGPEPIVEEPPTGTTLDGQPKRRG